MSAYKSHKWLYYSLLCLLLNGSALPPLEGATTGEKFDVLQIGTQSYTNVTVKLKDDIEVFFAHDGGIINYKVDELPIPLLKELGYTVNEPETPTATTETDKAKPNASKEASATSNPLGIKIEPAQVDAIRKQLEEAWRTGEAGPMSVANLSKIIDPKIIYITLGILVGGYLFFCLCCSLICSKAGHPAGLLVWLPVLQMFPLLRAAKMSGWWFLAFCVPILNMLAHVLWSLNIAKARGKHILVGILMILPVTNIFAFLYLAFSGAESSETEMGKPPILVLETA